MVFFFALAGKEVVDATASAAALHTWRRAAPARDEVALFFATAAFPPGRLRDQAKIGALLSVASAAVAFAAAAALGVGRFRASRAARP